ncbi:MAG: protein-L-isoaspartate(D-aspartate) O-methyltransferase [Alphaproteobacteria bacterium]|nr:protein-L-isoaspartate(D-aspartate) O-methyltransferase [Alphaproteobacteria bacterium]MCZ6846879.1 protein-L-isoaspartate(D-aspartate) O-methyltransferase [Alphaproteobacteria bacterium]
MTTLANKARLILALRSTGITDTAVLSAIERVPRELFVPETFRDQAYENTALPIGYGQTLSQPLVVASMVEALELSNRIKLLEVGTGSGYHAAILAQLCRRVYTIERHRPLLAEAERRFVELGLHNITTRAGDGMLGWPEQAPFERISVTAASDTPPAALLDQLAVGGIMVVPVGGRDRTQVLQKIRRTEAGYETHDLMDVRFVPLLPGLVETNSA